MSQKLHTDSSFAKQDMHCTLPSGRRTAMPLQLPTKRLVKKYKTKHLQAPNNCKNPYTWTCGKVQAKFTQHLEPQPESDCFDNSAQSALVTGLSLKHTWLSMAAF